MIGLYTHRESWLHRRSARVKCLALLIAGSCLFFINNILLLLFATITVLVLYRSAKLDFADITAQLKPALFLLALVFIGQIVFHNWMLALAVVLRLCCLILLANLISLTTRASDMMDVIVSALKPLALLNININNVGLVLTLTWRYIPLLFAQYGELREARLARGLKPGTLSLLGPLLIRSLRLSDQLAEAIEARAFDFRSRQQQDINNSESL